MTEDALFPEPDFPLRQKKCFLMQSSLGVIMNDSGELNKEYALVLWDVRFFCEHYNFIRDLSYSEWLKLSRSKK
jgi:hypothetical protein